LGVGPGNFGLLAPAYRPSERQRRWRDIMGERREVAYHAHNEYLELAAETGLVGLTGFVGLLLVVAYGSISTPGFGSAGSSQGILRLSCLAAVSATLVHSMVSFNLHDPPVAVYFWMLCGFLAVGVSSPSSRARTGLRTETAVDAPCGAVEKSVGSPVWVVGVAAGLSVVLCALGAVTASRLLMGDHFYFVGRRADRSGDTSEAIRALEKAVAWRGYDFRYHHMLALALWKSGHQVAARRELSITLTLHPHDVAALELGGRAYYVAGKDDSAAVLLERALRLDGTRAEVYALLATIRRRSGQHDLAIQAWRKALALRPDDPDLLNSLAVEYARAGDVSTAVRLLEQALHRHPGQTQIEGNLGSIYVSTGRTQEGLRLLLAALRIQPRETRWRLHLAAYYVNAGLFEAAAGQIRSILSYDPDNVAAQRLELAIRMNLEGKR